VAGGEPFRLAPQRRQLDPIDTVAPRIPLRQHGLVRAVGALELGQRPGCQRAHLQQFRLDRGVELRPELPPQQRRQQRIGGVGVREARCRLDERGHAAIVARVKIPRMKRAANLRSERTAIPRVASVAVVALVGLVASGSAVAAAPTIAAAAPPASTERASLPPVVDSPALAAAVRAARERFLARQSFDRLDVTVLVETTGGRWLRGAHGGDVLAYPASCVKLPFLVAAVHWCTAQGRAPDCLDADVRPMVVQSDNVATGRVVDAITGAPNVPWAGAAGVPLPGGAGDRLATTVTPPPEFEAWLERRRYTERLFAAAGLLDGQTLLNKTWPTNSGDSPEGYERLSLAVAGRNWMSADGAARLMLALLSGALVPEGRDYVRSLLERDRWSGHAAFGSGLPPGARLVAKIGTAYDTLQETAWIELPDGRRMVIAAFSNGWNADDAAPFDAAPLGSFIEDLLLALDSAALAGVPRGALPWSARVAARPGGSWTALPARGAYAGGTAWASAASGAEYAWRVEVPKAGRYELSVWYPAGDDRTPAARYEIDGREVPVFHDQRRWGARWLPLGEVDVEGTSVGVRVRSEAEGLLVVDTLRVSAVPASAGARGTARTDRARPRAR
jgi:protein phosphatase methylesterase 1